MVLAQGFSGDCSQDMKQQFLKFRKIKERKKGDGAVDKALFVLHYADLISIPQPPDMAL